MSGPTPGPWTAEWADGHKLAIVICAGAGLITHVNYCGPKDVENARLIAAAPDLLAALEKIASGEGYYGEQAREYKEIARAAIARAKGE